MRNPLSALAPQATPLTGTGARAYALAIATTLAGVGVTRVTWPLFAATPFAPLFAAIVVTTHWGTARAGVLAIVLAVAGAAVAFPSAGPLAWQPRTLIVFLPIAVFGSRVIVSRNRAAAALRTSETELRATWEHATLGAALLDRTGRVERINPALARLLGWPGASAVGLTFSAFSHPDEAGPEQQRLVDLLAGAEAFYQREQRYRRQDGTWLWGRVTVSAIRGVDGTPAAALAVLEDVTDRRQAELDLRESEQTLRRAQKMEAVGQLVAGVAHNFNNLLTVTMGYTDILQDRHGDNEADRNDLEEIRKATARGAALTRQLLAFGRKYEAMLARVDLNPALEDLRDLLTRLVREDIQLTLDLASAPLVVLIDPHDLEQVVLNLVINARDALPLGGAIHVDVSRASIDAPSRPSGVAVAPGDYVRLRVRDNGSGMTAEVQSHLFEPFFTTKEVGEGTGLGLAFVHGIAHHAGGFVKVDTAPAAGTTVSVYFPLVSDGLNQPPSPPAVPRVDEAPHGATILLVEDEETVREMAARVLTRAGYRLLAAASPAEAIALFARHAAEIDLLLTDIVMPDMHGPALAQRLVAQRPDLRVLFVSGYSDGLPDSVTATGRVAFLAKPFLSSRLVDAVAGLLPAPHGRAR